MQALESLRCLPPSSLFRLMEEREVGVRNIWIGVFVKCTKFLRSIVLE